MQNLVPNLIWTSVGEFRFINWILQKLYLLHWSANTFWAHLKMQFYLIISFIQLRSIKKIMKIMLLSCNSAAQKNFLCILLLCLQVVHHYHEVHLWATLVFDYHKNYHTKILWCENYHTEIRVSTWFKEREFSVSNKDTLISSMI